MDIEVVECGTPALRAWVDRRFDAWFRVVDEAVTAGRPSPVPYVASELRAEMVRPLRTERRLVLTGYDAAGRVVGGARVFLPLADNVALAFAEVFVAPSDRGHGHGTALLAAARDVAVEHGRTTVQTFVERPVDEPEDRWPGSVFCRSRGFSLALLTVRRDLELPGDAARWAALERDARVHARGYAVRVWSGPTPVADRARMAGLMARMSTDAPLGDLTYEAEVWDADRVEEVEDLWASMGRQRWTAVAVSPEGEWVAYSQLGWAPDDPLRMHQGDTLVVREHRGRRLGVLLKVVALRAARAQWPSARSVATWNAASNGPMIAVNEAMGFRPVEALEELEAPVAALRV